MRKSSLIRFSRFAFGNIKPNLEFAMPGMWTYRKPIVLPIEFDKYPIETRIGYEEITLKRWKIMRKNYQHDFVWGYGKITNTLIVQKE